MQKLIKVTEIYCRLKNNYDGAYEMLRKADDIFTPRNVRGDSLVWDLQGEGWTPLSSADTIMSAMVRGELAKRRQAVLNAFGEDKASWVEKVFTVPDDSCIFFRTDEHSGILKIRLTAWGYSYPTRPSSTDIYGGGIKEKENVNLKFTYGNEPLCNKTFSILLPGGGKNTFTTDNNGNFNFFGQPIQTGNEVNIEVDGKRFSFKVEKGKTDYPFDITKKISVIVKVLLDENPQEGVNVVSGNIALATGPDGTAHFETVLPKDGTMSVFVKGENTNGNQIKAVSEGENYFEFSFATPKEKEPSVVPPITEEKEQEKTEEGQSTKDLGEPSVNDKTIEESKHYDEQPSTTNKQTEETSNNSETPNAKEIIIGTTTYQETRLSSNEDNAWKKILLILGLVLLVAGAYYACYQILN